MSKLRWFLCYILAMLTGFIAVVIAIVFLLVDNVLGIFYIPRKFSLIYEGAHILGRNHGNGKLYVWWLVVRDCTKYLVFNVLLRTPIGLIKLVLGLPGTIKEEWAKSVARNIPSPNV